MRGGFRRAFGTAATVAALGVLFLVVPAADWLRLGSRALGADGRPDALYLVAGAEDQQRRVDALVRWLEQAAAGGAAVPEVLLSCDRAPWTPPDGPALWRWQVASNRLSRRQLPLPDGTSTGLTLRVVPGRFAGTDAEMETLARYLDAHGGGIGSLALVTSPFHARRAHRRLRKHLRRDVRLSVLTAAPAPVDRCPWTVLSELAKMARDGAGLSRCAMLSRREPAAGPPTPCR